MASKNIKGITIEIGGNTTKLGEALKDVDKKVYSLNGDLKALNQALKLDPKNTELLAQKQDVLKRNIQETKNRVDTLKEALRQMGDYNKLTDEQKQSYNQLSVEIAKSEKALRDMNEELKNTNKIDLSKVGNALKKVGEIAVEVTKKMLQVTGALAGALAGLVTAGIKSYAELEKAQKGSQRLFGDSFDTVQENASKAYKTMGISASKYYDQVNTYAVGLKNALNGDSKAAAQLSNDILVAQADIVAATGADAEAVSNAFAAVMRGNYTMIDNLRLGVKGSKEGMQEVIDKVNDWRKANGNTTKLVMGNYADMQQALVDYVKMQGIAGSAEKQMSSTITGSISQMKAAFDNFLNGSGSPEALAETITTVLKNISVAITKLAPNILKGVVSLVKTLLPQVIKMLFNLLPDLIKSINELIDELYRMVTQNTSSLQNAVTTIINMLVSFLTTNLPKILEIGIQVIVALAKGITESLPTIIPEIIDCVLLICDTILDNLDLIIDAGIELVVALIEGLTDPDTLEKLMNKVPIIIVKIVSALIKALPKIVEAGGRIIVALGQGILSVRDKLSEWMNTINNRIKDKIGNLGSKALQWGKDMLNGFIDGIKSKINAVGETAKSIGNKIKSYLHFSRPDEGPLREYETWMPDFVKGLANGIRKSSYLVEDASMGLANDIKQGLYSNASMALKSLNGSIQSSLNPTINPSVAYDLNYKLMAQAMVEALKEVKVDLDDRELGRFIDKTVSEEVFN